jgi:Holliday junction resolvasome RuvABC endonuclease subunit
MKSLGIDQSLTGTGLCVLEDGRLVYQELITTEGMVGHARLAHILERIESIVHANDPDVIQLEDYSMGPSGETAIKLIELGGLIKYALAMLGYHVGSEAIEAGGHALLVISAMSMKKFVLGKGNVQKDTSYLLTVMEKVGQRFENDNLADAYMHAWMATLVVQVLRGKVPISNLTNPQQEAMISRGVKKQKGLSIAKAMKLNDEDKRKLVRL